MKRKKILETKEIIESAIFEWYFERGKEVPNWAHEKDPQWWTDYLMELDSSHEQNNEQ